MARIALGGALLTVAALLLGFLVFAANVTKDATPPLSKADGVVALTGGALRIRRAAQLLAAGQAQRLLITGVNRSTGMQQLQALTGLRDDQFRCCVDIGYRALNTRGNADETHDWMRKHRFRSLIVVTANYHMPRSLAEFTRRLPDVRIYPHPVTPHTMRRRLWWTDGQQAAILALEYLKFLPASALCWISARLDEVRDLEQVPNKPEPKEPPTNPTFTLSAG